MTRIGAPPALRADRESARFGAEVSSCRWLLSLLVLSTALGACQRAEPAAQRATRALPSGVVARVGSNNIAQQTVDRIASAQRLTPAKALEKALPDALFALEARERLPPATRGACVRAAHARALLETLDQSARAQGPATDAEIRRIADERWIDLDRPVSVRVSHAVAMLSAGTDPSRAREVAEAIQKAVRDVRDPEAFLRAARAVPAGDVQVRAERLPYLTADGRGISTDASRPRTPAGVFDAGFSQAANELREPGDQSPIVQTRFGFHVLLLEDRLPERRVAARDLQVVLAPEVVSRRADALRRELVARLKATTPVEVQRDADAQTAQLSE